MTKLRPLQLNVPEPECRPGDTPDFSGVPIPKAGVVRRPEIDVANKLWEARAIDARRDHGSGSIPPGAAALQDVWWVLLNSNEFILNH